MERKDEIKIQWAGSGELVIRQGGDSREGFVLITPGEEERVLEYQIEMIRRNPHPRYIPVTLRMQDNQAILYYQVKNALSLQKIAAGRRIAWDEALRIIEGVAEGLAECRKYLLYSHCLLLDSSWIFVRPADMEVSLLYLPLALHGNAERGFREFARNFLDEVNLEEQEVYNPLYYRLIQGVSGEDFSLAGFSQTLKEVKYPQVNFHIKKPAAEKPFSLIEAPLENGQSGTDTANNSAICRIGLLLHTVTAAVCSVGKKLLRHSSTVAQAYAEKRGGSGEKAESAEEERPVMAREMRRLLQEKTKIDSI